MDTAKTKLYKDVKDAYLKFKSYVYHENFSIGLKYDIAVYESRDIEGKLSRLAIELAKCKNGELSSSINQLIQRVSFHLMPKKFKEESYDLDGGIYYSNKNLSIDYEIDDLKKMIPFIKCPIELHIIATLWVIKIGSRIENNLPECCYANRLYNLKKFQKRDRLRLYKRYYINYNKWRDNAIKTAKEIHSEGDSVAILNLDIESYYHSVDFELSDLKVSNSLKWLNQIIVSIHKSYVSVLSSHGVLGENPKKILPIGLITSNILANFYLRDLDLVIDQRLRPAFYGRYVDDFLLVFKNPDFNEKSKSPVVDFIKSNMLSKTNEGLRAFFSDNGDNSFRINVNNNDLRFQLSKVRLYYFKGNESIDLLDEFEKEIKKNSSEFRLQLEEDELSNPFEESVYQINYSDTINKLRSIDGFSHNKFGASKQLSKIIFTTKLVNNVPEEKVMHISEKVSKYFSGKRALELNSLWEKAFSYYVINKDHQGLIKFSKQIIDAISRVRVKIEKMDPGKNADINDKIFEGLLGHMIDSFSVAAALDINFFNKQVVDRLKRSTKKEIMDGILKDITVKYLKENAKKIINANLFKHSYAFFPLLNYCKQNSVFSFTSPLLKRTTNFELEGRKIDLSPRYINYHEVELFTFLKYNLTTLPKPKLYLTNRYLFNRKIHSFINSASDSKASVFNNLLIRTQKDIINTKLAFFEASDKLRIGIVNIKVDERNNALSVKGTPNLLLDRLNIIHKALNEAIENKVDLIIFPEISIPIQWLAKLTDFSKKNNIAIICGTEHFANSKEAFNYVVTILPFLDGYFVNAHVDLRLKIDYSPAELDFLENLGLRQPKDCSTEKMRLYNWRGVLFTVFNCFELSDIQKRAVFRGTVDIVFGIEYNKDIPYFSNINESYSRDIHAYTIQVNSSDYGDSRVTVPAHSVFRDYIKIKGGENISLLVGDIDIKALRDFQKLPYKKQIAKENKFFKPVPPNFKISNDRSYS